MEKILSKPKRPFVSEVRGLNNYQLLLTFENGEKRVLSMIPYLTGVFEELSDQEYFNRVAVKDGCIVWPNGQELAYDMLYYKSTSHQKVP